MFGALLGITDIISKEIGLKAVEDFVPEKVVELNLKAFERGYEIGQQLKAQ